MLKLERQVVSSKKELMLFFLCSHRNYILLLLVYRCIYTRERMIKMKYKVGRNNLALTVFVPWDCQNDCEFCTSKDSYSSSRHVETCMEKIKIQLSKYLNIGIKEFVFTGGEPLAAPCKLLELIKYVYSEAVFIEELSIYVNTSLPNIKYDEGNKKAFMELTRTNMYVDCFNISRHKETYDDDCNFFCGAIYDDSEIEKIVPKVRINTVYNCLDLTQYFSRWNKVLYRKTNLEISLRADYRFIDEDNLKSYNEEGFRYISEYPNMEFCSSSGCTVCNNDEFFLPADVHKGRLKNLTVMYHRGLESSARTIGETMLINDVIIDNKGDVSFDWNDMLLNQYIEDIDKAIEQHYLKLMPRTVNTAPAKSGYNSSYGSCGGSISTC